MDAEKENTFRVLRDQEPLVTSFWCKFGLHRWTKWKQHSMGSVKFFYRHFGRHHVFERQCVHCNYVSRRKQFLMAE